jgi:hypothetical protein
MIVVFNWAEDILSYLIIGLIVAFILYRILVYFGRKNAIDVLCHNFQLDREKVSQLKDAEITNLHFTLESARRKDMVGGVSLGEVEEIKKLVAKFR